MSGEEGSTKYEYRRVKDPPKWLCRELIQNCLKTSKCFHQYIVTNFEVTHGCCPSQSFFSSVFRVTLTLCSFDNSKQTKSIIIKCIPDYTNEDFILSLIYCFKKESMILSKIMDEVNELLRSVGNSELITAEWICGGEDPTNYLMMEDLSVTSYQMAKRQEGLDLNHSLLVMRLIAKYHAATAIIIQRDPAAVEDFKKCGRYVSGSDKEVRSILPTIVSHILSNLAKIPHFPHDVIDRISKLCESIVDKLDNLVQYKPQKFNVLVHGDLWVNNLMFRYCKEDVVSVKLLDFQESYISSPSHDLLFYLNSSLKEEVEINYSEYLIDEYYKTLNQTLSMLHYDGISYSVQDLKNDMKEYKLIEIFSSLFVSAFAIASEDSSVPFEGTSRGHLDYIENIYSNPIYIEKLGRKLLSFVEKGFFVESLVQ